MPRSGPKRKADRIVLELLSIMLRGRFEPGKTIMELAAKHAVSQNLIRRYLEEARRHLRLGRGPKEDVRELVIANIEKAIKATFEAKDFEALQKFLGMLIDMHGLNNQVDVSLEELRQLLVARGVLVQENRPDGQSQGIPLDPEVRRRLPAGAPRQSARGGQAGLPQELDPDFSKS